MAKAYGHEIVDFFESEWPEGWYVDENCKSVDAGKIYATDEVGNEREELSLTERFDLDDFGVLIHPARSDPSSLTPFFNKWKKGLSVVSLIVEVPKEKEDEIRGLLVNAGCNIRR